MSQNEKKQALDNLLSKIIEDGHQINPNWGQIICAYIDRFDGFGDDYVALDCSGRLYDSAIYLIQRTFNQCDALTDAMIVYTLSTEFEGLFWHVESRSACTEHWSSTECTYKDFIAQRENPNQMVLTHAHANNESVCEYFVEQLKIQPNEQYK